MSVWLIEFSQCLANRNGQQTTERKDPCMFTGITKYERLSKKKVSARVLDDINRLLKQQRPNAKPITKERLLECLEKMAVVVAWNDGERVVGLGVLTQAEGLNFTYAEIRHLVISDGGDVLATGIGIVTVLRDLYLNKVDYIDAGVWVQHPEMTGIFTALGFKEKPGSQFRLRGEISA